MTSLSEAARRLGCSRHTISDLCRIMKIETSPHPSNRRAKAISDRDLDRIRVAFAVLGPPADAD